ncbi:MAG: hypothetical protein Ct9H300mP32_3840 [Verrucomicrobiota bacterium]|nr:MAG: hypothetical protein Ct9H300mP32_3840 [Verrucomicrobiota bacterium]
MENTFVSSMWLGSGCLHEHTVHSRVSVEFREQLEQLGLRVSSGSTVVSERMPSLAAVRLLHANVNLRCRILPDADKHKPGSTPSDLSVATTGLGLRVNLPSDRAAVYQVIGRIKEAF